MRIFNNLLARLARYCAHRYFADDVRLVVAGMNYYGRRVYVTDAARRVLQRALIAGEDRRFMAHQGADLRAIVRAAVSTFVKGQPQGGSTIEQQLVRTIRRRYEFTLRRKISEICVACAISERFAKPEICRIYLAAAYFGYGSNGITSALRRHGYWHGLTDTLSDQEAARIIAMLRYPLPRHPSEPLLEKVQKRTQRILQGMGAE